MKCPIRHHQQMIKPEHISSFDHECLKEECAWWRSMEHECSVYALARESAVIKNSLYEIANKMPHEEQFRR